jgi:hypothetical protein
MGRFCSASLLLALSLLSPALNAEVQVPPGFRVELFASTTAYGMAFGPGGAFGTDLYVSTGTAIERVAPDGTPSSFATGLASANGIAFSNGDAFGLYLYVLDGGVNEVQRIDSAGQRTPFASVAGDSAVNLNDLVFGSGVNGFSGNLFVSDGGHRSGVTGKIHEVAPDGAVSLFFGRDPLTAAGITFAAGSGFGPSALILADAWNHRFDDGGVRCYDATGAFRTIIDAGRSVLFNPGDVVQGPGGAFGTDLFVSDWSRDAIYTLTADGDLTEFASGFSFENWDRCRSARARLGPFARAGNPAIRSSRSKRDVPDVEEQGMLCARDARLYSV